MQLIVAIALAVAAAWALASLLKAKARYSDLSAEHSRAQDRLKAEGEKLASASAEIRTLREYLETAKPYIGVANAVAEADRIREEARVERDSLRAGLDAEITVLKRESQAQARERLEKAELKLAEAGTQAKAIVDSAQRRAEEIAGDAYKALKNADQIKRVVDAMENKIAGYGDRYLVPTYNLLDELADAYDFADAGKELKLARKRSQLLVEQGRAATCQYVETNRREAAIRFVLDAFNGKVDSILSRTKSDNAGTLKQQIVDAAAMVNYNGSAFRDARIAEEYLQARLDELKWAAAASALQERDREEQRRLKAQIRDEERAQRDYERAQKEAQREEAAVKKAMARMQEQLLKATDEQRLKFESQLAELSAKLTEAEARNQRALSMAQLTRAGHVYIISNVGSFGENVYKIGMTRRLEPMDRVRELGDASVPFTFDVHAIIRSDDAPRLERELHRKFLLRQINKVNPRKEFFRVGIAELKNTVEAIGAAASWTIAAEATEFRESMAIEEQIKTDPTAREHWVRHQMLVDPVVVDTVVEDEDSASASD